MSELHVVVPCVISVNALYMTTRTGKRIRTARGKAWFADAEALTAKAIAEQHWQRTEKTKVVVEVYTAWPDARRRDTNNSSKALADMLEHAGVYDDDKYALLRFIDYGIDRENPRSEIIVRLFDPAVDSWKFKEETICSK